jgi:diguanylate cyclase (GGDEF)-like protein/PAS domain S-box-containing protein
MKDILIGWLDEVLPGDGDIYKNSIPPSININSEKLINTHKHKQVFALTIADYYAGDIQSIKQRHERLGKEHYKTVNIVYCKKFLKEVEFAFNKKLLSVLYFSRGNADIEISENIIEDIKNIFSLISDYMSLGYLKSMIEEENIFLGEAVETNMPEGGLPELHMPFLLWNKHVMDDVYNESRKPSVELDPDKCSMGHVLFSEELAEKLPPQIIRNMDILHRRLHKETGIIYDLLHNNFYGNIDLAYHSSMELNMLLFSVLTKESGKVALSILNKAKEDIKSSEQRLRTFFNKLPVPSLILEVETGLIIDVNEKALEFYGYSTDEFRQMNVAVINPFAPAEETLNIRAKALNEGYNYAVFKHKLKNGNIRDVEAYISGVIYNGKAYTQSIVIDITEKVEAQARSRRLFDFNTALAQINQIIAQSADEKEMLKFICEIAVKYAGFKVAHIDRPDENGRLQPIAAAGALDFLDGIFISVDPGVTEGQGLLGRTWREGKTHYAESLSQSPNLAPWKERTERFGIQSTAALPIYRGGKIWALFAMHHWDKNVFDDSDLQVLMEETAKNISRGLDRIDVLTRESELAAMQDAILGNTIAGISVTDRHRHYVNLNSRFAQIFGYGSKDELLGQSPRILYFDDEEYNRVGKFNKNIFEDNKNVTISPILFKRKDGAAIWCEMSGSSAIINGEVAAVWTLYDITERKLMEEQLKQERDLFEILIENINSGIALYDKDKFLYINQVMLDLFHYTNEEFLNLKAADFFNIETGKIYNSNSSLFKIHSNNEPSSRIIYKYIKDGKIYYIDLFRTAVTYIGKQTGLAMFTDVTDQILKEQNILVEKDAFKELSEHDALTGINNRRSFGGKLDELLNISLRYGRPLSLIMFDIDRFKNINDTYGHEIGDFILKEICAVIKEDLRNTDFFARYGGEEFVVIAPETSLSTAVELAERLRLKSEKHDFNIGQYVTCSFGVTEAKGNDTPQSIIYRADAALYEAKETGRNKVCY